MVVEGGSSEEICGQSFATCATLHLLGRLTSSNSVQKPAQEVPMIFDFIPEFQMFETPAFCLLDSA
jgi:hypothetical protein